MPDDPEFDPAWLYSLGKKFDQLRQELKETAKQRDESLIKYRKPNNENEEGDDVYDIIKDDIIRKAAIRQLTSLVIFMEDDRVLLPDLYELLQALHDLHSGRTVNWLRPKHKKGQPPPPIQESSLRGRYAAVMDWLMKEGGKTKEEAAKFVVEHGGIRRRPEVSGRARRAVHPWETVANWRDRATRSDAPVPERAAFDRMYRLIRSSDPKKVSDAGIEDFAKFLIRLANYFHSPF